MTRDEAILLIEEAAARDAGTVKGEETLEAIVWDSLATINLIAAVDAHDGRTLDAKVLAKCKTVPDLLAILVA